MSYSLSIFVPDVCLFRRLEKVMFYECELAWVTSFKLFHGTIWDFLFQNSIMHMPLLMTVKKIMKVYRSTGFSASIIIYYFPVTLVSAMLHC